MKNNFSPLGLFSVLSIFAAAILFSCQTPARAEAVVGVKIMQKEMLGKFLADGNGITLYSFARDEMNISHCTEGCAANWPPFYADPSALIEGCESSDFATITRTDGRKQSTYKGRPLYYFKNDKYPGDTFGHGIGGVWFLVIP